MITFYLIATFLMLVALIYQIAKIGKVSKICLTACLSFLSFWFSYHLVDDAKQFYVIECFRSAFVCLVMYLMYLTSGNENTKPFLLYSIVLVSQTIVSLLQLLVNISGYTDPIYTVLSLTEIALFIYGFTNLQRLHNGDTNNSRCNSACSPWGAWLCNTEFNEEGKK